MGGVHSAKRWAEESASGQIQANWTESDSDSKAYIKNKPNLATVATSGSYTDLSNKPTIPDAQIQSDWSQSDNTQKDFIKNKPNLANVATSGSYNDLLNKPTIPTVPTTLSAFTDDLGTSPIHTHSQYLTAHQDISGKENTSNKTTTLDGNSTDTQYPSAKVTWDSILKYNLVQDINSLADGTITLNYANSLHKRVVTANTTFTFSTTNLSLTSSVAYTFELLVTMSTAKTLTFPNSVTWANSETPYVSQSGSYYFAFRTVDAGTTWHGSLEGRW